MMKIKRCFTLLLCIVMTLSFSFVSMPASAEISSPSDYKCYNLNIFSNVCDITSSEIYEHDSKFYMSIEDIAALARFSLNTEVGESSEDFILTQGVRVIRIQKETGFLIDHAYYIHCSNSYEHIIEETNIPFLMIDSQYYYECVPLLTYLGAECRVSELGGLIVTMPAYTLWEAIAPNMEKYWRDTNITNQSVEEKQWSIRINVANDLLGDVWSIPEKWGDTYKTGEYLEQSLYEILDVNVMSFDSVQKLIGEENKATNDNVEALLTANETLFDTYGALKGLGDYGKAFDAFGETVSDVDSVNFSFVMATLDSFYTIDHRINYDEHTKNCFANVLNDDVMEYLNEYYVDSSGFTKTEVEEELEKLNEMFSFWNFRNFTFADIGFSPHWKDEALEISKILNDSEKITEDVLWDKYTSAANEIIMKSGAETAIAMLTNIGTESVIGGLGGTVAPFALLSYSLMTDVALKDSFDASKSDIYSYCLSDMQYDILEPLTFVSMDVVCDDECKDIKKMEIMKDMIALYYRITIAFSQNNAKAIEEYGFGKTKREQAVAHYNQVAETLAVYLYKITNCTVSEIPDYNELSDSIMTEEWMEQFAPEEKMDDDFINAVIDNESSWTPIFSSDNAKFWFQDMNFDGQCELIVGGSSGLNDGCEYYYVFSEYEGGISGNQFGLGCYEGDELIKLVKDKTTDEYLYLNFDVLNHEIDDNMVYQLNEYRHMFLTTIAQKSVTGDTVYWLDGDYEKISESKYVKLYNSCVQNLIEYDYTTDVIMFSDYKSMTRDEKYKRLRESYYAFEIGDEIGTLPLLEEVPEYTGDYSEEELKAAAMQMGTIILWQYHDYDGNGTKEAFALVGADEYIANGLYFINSSCEVLLVKSSFNRADFMTGGSLECQGKYFFWAELNAGGPGSDTLLWSVRDDQPFELDLSCSGIIGFYEENGTYYTWETEAVNGRNYYKVELFYDPDTQQFYKGQVINDNN